MAGQWLGRVTIVLAVLAVVTGLAWVTSDDLPYNPASFEPEPLQLGVAPQSEAITLARFRYGRGHTGRIITLLVEHYDGDTVTGVIMASVGASGSNDPFVVYSSITPDVLARAAAGEGERLTVDAADLLPSGPLGDRHIGIGTNFPEHAEEANSESVFNFPKFGWPTPARTSIATTAGDLLDYEVELCVRFDRLVRTMEDFDAAVKAFFLCADFTDRIALVELADMDNLDSGYGFSDAKSGPGFFPTGPFLVFPNDWRAFIAQTRMTTAVNGQPRQDARGGEMIMDFRALTEKVLGDLTEPRFYYQGDYYPLTREEMIDTDMVLMSGTSEGVIFTGPARHDYIELGLSYVFSGQWLEGVDLMDYARSAFIERELASGHFLQPGDTVTYRSSTLGEIVVAVQEADQEADSLTGK